MELNVFVDERLLRAPLLATSEQDGEEGVP